MNVHSLLLQKTILRQQETPLSDSLLNLSARPMNKTAAYPYDPIVHKRERPGKKPACPAAAVARASKRYGIIGFSENNVCFTTQAVSRTSNTSPSKRANSVQSQASLVGSTRFTPTPFVGLECANNMSNALCNCGLIDFASDIVSLK